MTDLRELYQSVILDHNRAPRNYGPLPAATAHADGHNPLCGDTVTVWVTLDGDRIDDVHFVGEGCAISKASASLMTTVLKGRASADASALADHFHALVTTRAPIGAPPPAPESRGPHHAAHAAAAPSGPAALSEDYRAALGRLAPLAGVSRYPERVKCATLAWHAFHAALERARALSGDAFVPVAGTAELLPGAIRSVRLPSGEQVVLVNMQGEICALEDRCSHETYELSAGELLPDGTIECVWHGARFDCRTGAACHPPAIESVATYPVRVADGTIFVGPRRTGR